MNRRKKIITSGIVAIILLIVGLTISFAKIDPNNTYTIVADKTNVQANDIVTVTLKVKIPGGSKGIQGRIEYDTNLTFLEDEVSKESYGDYGELVLASDPNVNAIGFSKVISEEGKVVSGDVTVVKLKFKVTGLTGGNYKIYWKDYNENGYFEIASVTLNRTDIADIVIDVDEEEDKKGTSVDDIIDQEANKENNIKDEETKEPTKENVKEETKQPIKENVVDKSGSNKILPKTGEKPIQLITIICSVLLAVCIYIRIKFFGKELNK